MWADTLTHLIAFALGFLSNVLFDKYKRRCDREDKLKEKTDEFKEDIKAKINEFESIWTIETREENKHLNTNRIKADSEILGNKILKIVHKHPSDIPPDTLEKLNEIATELIGMRDFRIRPDGRKSYNAFIEKGNNILNLIKKFKKEDWHADNSEPIRR